MPSTRKSWIIGAVLLALVVAAVAWLLLISPVREVTVSTKKDAEQVESSNEILDAKVTKLRAQFAEIDTYRAELKEFESHIPSVVDYQSIIDEIERSIEASEVALISIDSSEGIAPVTPFTALKVEAPAAVDPNAPVVDAEDEDEAQAPSEITTVSGAQPTLTGALATVVPGFFQIPLVVTVQGDYEGILEFSEALQIGSERVLLVSAVSATSLRDTPETDTAPEAEVGDITYELSVLAYVLEYDRSVLGEDSDGDDQTEVSLPPAAKDNIFAPER